MVFLQKFSAENPQLNPQAKSATNRAAFGADFAVDFLRFSLNVPREAPVMSLSIHGKFS